MFGFFFQKFKKKKQKNKKKNVERMAQGKQQPKFERNPFIRFRDNCDTDRQTTDKLQFHELCCRSEVELKNKLTCMS